MDETTQAILTTIVASLVGGGTIGGLIIWTVKKLVTALVSQNKSLIDSALKNMEANTQAIDANTNATRSLSNTLTQAIAIRDERDKSIFKQLDRIEDKIKARG